MKKHIILYVVFFVSMVSIAQAQNVGISAISFTPDAHAMLHVSGNGAGVGILIPNMMAATRIGMTPDATDYGLLVYQTNTVSATNAAGYWYWDGSAWTRLFNGGSNGWSLTGNALTGGSSATPNEWIGSSNAYDWVVKTNNTERMRIRSAGWVGINITPVANTQLRVDNTTGNAIYATTSADGGYGVYGQNTSTGTTNMYGVYGYKSGNADASFANGYGVTGIASGTASANYGGYFSATDGTTNLGVYARGTDYGVYGITSTNGGNGVYGLNNSTGAGSLCGVYGSKTGAATGTGYGIYGTATNTAATNYGGYFTGSGGTSNYGIYASGTNYGGYCTSAANNGIGLYAANTAGAAGTGNVYAIRANVSFAGGAGGTTYAVYAKTDGGSFGSGTHYGLYAETAGSAAVQQSFAVYGKGGYYGGYFTGSRGAYGEGSDYGVKGFGTLGPGVYGENNYTGNSTVYGVRGEATGANTDAVNKYGRIGVYGQSITASAANYGVKGAAYSATDNYGVYGGASGGTNNYGVYGYGSNYGVYGHSGSSTSTVPSYAVYAFNEADGDQTVYGVKSELSGIGGDPTDVGTGYAMHATAEGRRAINYAGYFNTSGQATFDGAATTNYGINIVVDAWNAATNYGLKTDVTSVTTGTNYGAYLSATGGGGATNYALVVPSGGGNVGFQTITPAAALDVAGTVKLGSSGTVFTYISNTTVAKDLPSIASNSRSVQTFAVTTASTTNSTVIISPQNAMNGIVIEYARVSAVNTVEVGFTNNTAGAVDLANMNFYITVIKY